MEYFLKSKNNLKSSNEVFEWISRFINLERGQKPKSFRLDRMEFLTELAGNPHRCAPSFHIAGSKGKGSVTGMLAAMLTAAGYRAARYMSPHVIDIRERICLNDSYFSEDVYCAAGNELFDIIKIRLPEAVKVASPMASQTAAPIAASSKALLFNPATEEGCEPTYFELMTLYFFLCAKHGNCDVMVVETGMGGRLDSTNILDPLVSVITLIELEHTSFLGDTIEKVAGEKAGIIKQGKPLVLAKQNDEALEVFRKKAAEQNSLLFYLPKIANLSDINITRQGTEFSLSFSSPLCLSTSVPLCDALRLSIPIPGKVQAQNAALAIIALKIAFPNISDNAIHQGLANLKIPARFENISQTETQPFIIDGAHTPESLELCIDTFCSLYGEEGILLFGCAADKDAAAMATIAYKRFSKIIVTTPGAFKSSNPALVYEAFISAARQKRKDVKTLLVKDTLEAIGLAQELARKDNLPILGAGSFYLVSEIRKAVCS